MRVLGSAKAAITEAYQRFCERGHSAFALGKASEPELSAKGSDVNLSVCARRAVKMNGALMISVGMTRERVIDLRDALNEYLTTSAPAFIYKCYECGNYWPLTEGSRCNVCKVEAQKVENTMGFHK